MSFRIMLYLTLSFFNLCHLAYWLKLARNASDNHYILVPELRSHWPAPQISQTGLRVISWK